MPKKSSGEKNFGQKKFGETFFVKKNLGGYILNQKKLCDPFMNLTEIQKKLFYLN